MLQRLALAIGIALSALVAAKADDKDLKALDGTWIPQSGELGGAKFPDEILKTIKLEMKDGNYSVNVGQQLDKGTIKIDAAKKPKEMDIAGSEGPNKGKTFPAIYELDGDMLKICYDLSGKERPKAFKTDSSTMTLLIVYKRAK